MLRGWKLSDHSLSAYLGFGLCNLAHFRSGSSERERARAVVCFDVSARDLGTLARARVGEDGAELLVGGACDTDAGIGGGEMSINSGSVLSA